MYGTWSWHTFSYAFGFIRKTGCDNIPDFNFLAHRCCWIWFLSTSSRVPWIFNRWHIAFVSICGIHRLSILIISRKAALIWSLAKCGRITLTLTLIKFASADLPLIYRLAIQIASISFYSVEIDDRLFHGLLHLNLGYLSCAVGIKSYCG